ncbi:MAG: sigma 54-interacting transcriptional regulator [Vicinamibacterales bacterium]|nr:sigma 54-interacting transcriptional regulator [Vicinamibacterales bacterium]
MATATARDEAAPGIRRGQIEAVLNRVRPLLRADGLDIALVDLQGDGASVRLAGPHATCGSTPLNLHTGLAEALRDEIPDFGALQLLVTPQPWERHPPSAPARGPTPCDQRQAGARTPAPLSDEVVVGPSARMQAVFAFVRTISESESTVLITGETGTGKEVTATSIHEASRRRGRPFVAVSCALFSDEIVESELFGHTRGAFTGAAHDRAGRFELADGGTLFLDDLDDVPLSMQVKLLRVLQDRTVQRVGGSHTIPVDVRILAGTKRDLKHLVASGTFREDLYHRLNVLSVLLPPLRERREDIPMLMDHFLSRYCRRRGEAVPAIASAVQDAFLRYPWPGNVRELEHACERMAQTCTCGTMRTGCLSMTIMLEASKQPTLEALPPEAARGDATPFSLDARMREEEATLIGWALEASGGNKTRAAALLQIKRTTLGDRIERCGLNA